MQNYSIVCDILNINELTDNVAKNLRLVQKPKSSQMLLPSETNRNK